MKSIFNFLFEAQEQPSGKVTLVIVKNVSYGGKDGIKPYEVRTNFKSPEEFTKSIHTDNKSDETAASFLNWGMPTHFYNKYTDEFKDFLKDNIDINNVNELNGIWLKSFWRGPICNPRKPIYYN